MARRTRSLRSDPLRGLTLALALECRDTDEHDAGFRRTARLAIVAGGTWSRGPRKPRLEARANRRELLPDRLSLATPPEPHIAFARAPPCVRGRDSGRDRNSDGVSDSPHWSRPGVVYLSQRPESRQDIAQTSSSAMSMDFTVALGKYP